MMKSTLRIVSMIALGFVLTSTGCSADIEETVKPGDKMPNFTMKDYEGNEHTLEQYQGKIVVLEFCSHKCPYSRGADPHISELAKSYEDEPVVFLGIDSHKATPPEEIKAYAEDKKAYPVLKDVDNEYADKVAATNTPEMYIVDKEGKLAYRGAYDNRSNPKEKGEKNYTKAAIDDLLAGEEVEQPRVKAWGCTIKRK